MSAAHMSLLWSRAEVTDTHGAAAALGWPLSRVVDALRTRELVGEHVSGKARMLFLDQDLRLWSASALGAAEATRVAAHMLRPFPVPGSSSTGAYRWVVVLPGKGSFERAVLEAPRGEQHLIDPDNYEREEDA
jgi:hypothetical protein